MNNDYNLDEINQYLLNEFTIKPLESDLLISLFYTSLYSSQNHIKCNPFPTAFIDKGKKDYESIENLFKLLPNVYQLSNIELPVKLKQLLVFILKNDSLNVNLIDYKTFQNYTRYSDDLLDHLKVGHKPSRVFQFSYRSDLQSTTSKLHQQFELESKDKGVLFGYHGSSNENWNNIIKGRGFSHQFISEGCLFGNGFYFSSDYKVSQTFVKWGKWWDRSIMGSNNIGCLSACEIINTNQTQRGLQVFPLKFNTDINNNNVQQQQQQQQLQQHHNYNHTDEDKQLPDHYILVKEPSHIRVKYLLIFEDISKQQSTIQNNNNNILSFKVPPLPPSRNNINNNNNNNNNNRRYTKNNYKREVDDTSRDNYNNNNKYNNNYNKNNHSNRNQQDNEILKSTSTRNDHDTTNSNGINPKSKYYILKIRVFFEGPMNEAKNRIFKFGIYDKPIFVDSSDLRLPDYSMIYLKSFKISQRENQFDFPITVKFSGLPKSKDPNPTTQILLNPCTIPSREKSIEQPLDLVKGSKKKEKTLVKCPIPDPQFSITYLNTEKTNNNFNDSLIQFPLDSLQSNI
eukprot:gene7507-9225_t